MKGMQGTQSAQDFYNTGNISHIRKIFKSPIASVLYFLAAVIIMLTFFGNMVVIVSILHFKQLHTPTNVLVLSLAIADFLVGVLIMPFMVINSIETCWYFGDHFCVVYTISLYLLTDSSIMNMVLIAVDRNIAICNPLIYSNQMTIHIASLSSVSVWIFSLIYACVIKFFDGAVESQNITDCTGQCQQILRSDWNTADLVISFIIPISIIITLYTKIFIIARKHAKAISTQEILYAPKNKNNLSTRSERKAARTLGIVVTVFICCWLPYFMCTVIDQFTDIFISPLAFSAFMLLAYVNSSINPIIYALFYPWFQKSLKLFVTFKIFIPGSSLVNVYN
uniref:G-protein coupled receptors family 1 profile domain-containing protein n=1 Tax=Erpetoichthys calabaricus TaxID=27687 RepID=A0A8C4RKL9_ERPCA